MLNRHLVFWVPGSDLPGGLIHLLPFMNKGLARLLKNLPAYEGETGLICGFGRSPGEENGNPLQYSCLRNNWWATVSP